MPPPGPVHFTSNPLIILAWQPEILKVSENICILSQGCIFNRNKRFLIKEISNLPYCLLVTEHRPLLIWFYWLDELCEHRRSTLEPHPQGWMEGSRCTWTCIASGAALKGERPPKRPVLMDCIKVMRAAFVVRCDSMHTCFCRYCVWKKGQGRGLSP